MSTENAGQMPTITSYLSGLYAKHMSFVRPTAGDGIEPVCDRDTENSPRARQMAIRKLRIVGMTAIPFHRHLKKEKALRFVGGATVDVLLLGEDGTMTTYYLYNPNSYVVVPAGRPHAVVCYPNTEEELFAIIDVITSTQDGTDIEWEPETEELLKNEHLKPAHRTAS